MKSEVMHVNKMLCLFIARTIRSTKVAKKSKTILRKPTVITKKPHVVKKAKPQVKKSVSPPVATDTVPRMYWD